MKQVTIKYIRSALAICFFVASSFCLYWGGLPKYQAIVTLGAKGLPLTKTGAELIVVKNGAILENWKILALTGGWPGLVTIWPLLLSVLMVGIVIGYIFGELARRSYATEQISAEAVRKSQELEASASNKLITLITSAHDINEAERIVLLNKSRY